MIRTVSPCCQSSGAKNRPQTRLTAVSSPPDQNSHGRTLPGQPQELARIGEPMQRLARAGRRDG